MLSDQVYAVIRVGAVPNHVAKAPKLVYSAGVDAGENRLKRLSVGMDIRDNGYAHGIKCSPRR